jgi:hypothetical protein
LRDTDAFSSTSSPSLTTLFSRFNTWFTGRRDLACC